MGQITRQQFLIGAPRRSSGKTTLAAGLCAEFARAGREVFPYKKGPDYIDPMWLHRAASNVCLNLDLKMQTPDEIAASLARAGEGSVVVVEANMALHDGASEGDESGAALAERLDLPVVIVVDCRGMTRSVAPLLLGYTQFAPQMKCAGVVLNRVAGERHERTLRRAIEEHTSLRVLGVLPEDERIKVIERELGLTPTDAHGAATDAIECMRKVVARRIDMDALAEATRVSVAAAVQGLDAVRANKERLLVGVVRDEAFCFYYPDDLQRFADAGAELRFIDALRSERLEDIDGLFIGGGFPERHAERISANAVLRAAVKTALERGLPAYAECGGLMYLARTLEWEGRRHPMVGFFEADAVVHKRPCGKGYMKIRETDAMPWPARARDAYYAHEFHYSELRFDAAPQYAYEVIEGAGLGDGVDGVVQRNVLASYLHRRGSGRNDWPGRFCEFIRRCKAERAGAHAATG